MRLKFLGHRGHWKRWPEEEVADAGVLLGFVESFAGPFLELLFPAARLPLPLGVPSILGGDGWIAQAGGYDGVENACELLEWCGREVVSHQRRDTRGWSLGSLRERWSCDVLAKWTGSGDDLRLRESQTARLDATGSWSSIAGSLSSHVPCGSP